MLLIEKPNFSLASDRRLVKSSEFATVSSAADIIAAAEKEAARIREEAKAAFEEEKKRGYEKGLRDGKIEISMQKMDQVAAVIDDEVRAGGQGILQQSGVFLLVYAVLCVDFHAAFRKRGSHVILRGEGVAAGDVHLRAAQGHDPAEIGGLRLHMDGQRDLQTGEGAGLFKLRRDGAEQGHMGLHPGDLPLAGGGQGNITDGAHASTAFLRASARSVCSHVTPRSSRPIWP